MPALEKIKLEHGSATVVLEVLSIHASFIKQLSISFTIDLTDALSAIELHAAFIQHCVESGNSEAALAVFYAFCHTFNTATRDIHVIINAQGLEEDAARRVLKGYFSAWPLVNSNSNPSFVWPVAPSPTLFSSESAGLMAMFGGQRGTTSYLDEAEWLLDVYRPLLLDFVTCMSEFLHHESKDKRVASMYSKGLDMLHWLTTVDAMPNDRYLLSIPVCMPLVALIQLMHVMVLYKTLGVSPGDLVKRFK
ncbi:hypothetical protein IWW38_004254, partial [Coemansia aciculifera]